MKDFVIFSVSHDDKILYIGSKCSSLNTLSYSNVFFNIPSNIKRNISQQIGQDNITIKIEHKLNSSLDEIEKIRKNLEMQLMHKIKSKQEINKTYYTKARQNKITCECGSIVIATTLKQHLKTRKHIEFHNAYHSCEE